MVLTQTSVKDLERLETCPLRWKAQWIDKSFSSPESLHMLKGKYFEWLLFGANAKQDEKAPVLPPLKNGGPSIDQRRIEQQAARLRPILEKEFFSGKQVFFQKYLNYYDTGGTLDILISGTPIIVMDVKLTQDITSTRTKYGWGNDWTKMDLLQPQHYSHLVEKTYGTRPSFIFVVADYSPRLNFEISEISLADTAKVDYLKRFDSARQTIEEYNSSGWPVFPSEYECEKCPLKCDKRWKLRT